jgi:rubrerythrin
MVTDATPGLREIRDDAKTLTEHVIKPTVQCSGDSRLTRIKSARWTPGHDILMGSVVPAVVSLRDLLARALAMRREAAAGYRRLAMEPAVREAPQVARVFSRLAVLEAEQAARIERDLPDLDVGMILAEEVMWAQPVRPARPIGSMSLDDALETARHNERGMRAIFEHIAATSPNEAVRIRALQFALAETRHLSTIEEVVAAARDGGKA